MSLRFGPWTDDAADLGGLGKVWSLTYTNGEPYTEWPTVKYSELFAAWQGEAVVGAYGILPMEVTRGQAALKCAGVFAVAVAPHIRGAGVGQGMMAYHVRQSREAGYLLGALYPFDDRFYRKVGYETCGIRYVVSVDAPTLKRYPSDLPVRVLGPEGAEVIHDCYLKWAHERSGLNTRPGGHWQRVLPSDSHRTVYVAGDPAEGYLVLQHKSDFWVDQHISEFVATTRRAYEALLNVIAAIGINKTAVSWAEASDSPYRASYWHRGASVKETTPQIMYRVLDVPGALRALKPGEAGSFTLRVEDALVPENRGPWKVTFEPGAVAVEPCDSASLSLDIRQFTQAFLGEPSLADLARSGWVQGDGLSEAQKLLPASPTLCMDFF